MAASEVADQLLHESRRRNEQSMPTSITAGSGEDRAPSLLLTILHRYHQFLEETLVVPLSPTSDSYTPPVILHVLESANPHPASDQSILSHTLVSTRLPCSLMIFLLELCGSSVYPRTPLLRLLAHLGVYTATYDYTPASSSLDMISPACEKEGGMQMNKELGYHEIESGCGSNNLVKEL
jgi:hypothetical protein